MYGFCLKNQNPFLKCDLELFSVLKISPWGSKSSVAGGPNRVLPGVNIECTRGQIWVHPHKHRLCVDALNFDPRQHSILTPSSTWFCPPRLIFKTEKSYTSQFQNGFGFVFKAIHLILFLRFFWYKVIL